MRKKYVTPNCKVIYYCPVECLVASPDPGKGDLNWLSVEDLLG